MSDSLQGFLGDILGSVAGCVPSRAERGHTVIITDDIGSGNPYFYEVQVVIVDMSALFFGEIFGISRRFCSAPHLCHDSLGRLQGIPLITESCSGSTHHIEEDAAISMVAFFVKMACPISRTDTPVGTVGRTFLIFGSAIVFEVETNEVYTILYIQILDLSGYLLPTDGCPNARQ